MEGILNYKAGHGYRPTERAVLKSRTNTVIEEAMTAMGADDARAVELKKVIFPMYILQQFYVIYTKELS